MSAVLNGNDSNRLVEALAGSAVLMSDPAQAGSQERPAAQGFENGHGQDDAPPAANHDSTPPLVQPTPGTVLADDPSSGDSSTTPGSAAISPLGNLLGVDSLLNSGTDSQLDLAGPSGALQPVFDATNILVKDVHDVLETLSHQTGSSDIVHAITNLGETAGLGNIGVVPPAADDGHSNLLTDVVNLPATLLGGGLDDAVSQIGGDLTDTVHAALDVVDSVLQGGDPLNPVPELIQNVGLDLLQHPIAALNSDGAGDGGLLGGGLLSGSAGSITGSSTGHLVDVDAGPENPHGFNLDVLASSGNDPSHTASVNVIDVGSNGPQLLGLGVLTDGGILDIPGLGGSGADSLTGNLDMGGLPGGLSIGDVVPGMGADAPVTAPFETANLLSPLTGDHGILDLHSTHIL